MQWWPVTGATSYTVYYSTSPGVTTSSTSFGPVTEPYATITGLTGNTFYYFRVVASNGFGSSTVNLFEAIAYTTATLPGMSLVGTHVDISAGGIGSGNNPSAVLDPMNGKLLVVTANGPNSGKVSLFRCNLDGSSCTHADISVGQSASTASAVLDSANGKIIVATQNGANGHRPSLFIW